MSHAEGRASARPDADRAARIAARFGLRAPTTLRRIESGHINESFEARDGHRALLLQWINPVVFPRAGAVQDNVERVLAHLHERAPEIGAPRLLAADDGRLRVDDDGALWRALEWLPDHATLVRPDTPRRAADAGAALGRFLRALDDLPAEALDPVLADFHDLGARLADHDAALAEASAERRASATALVERVERERGPRLAEEGAGRRRVIHGDPKFTNVLFPPRGAPVLVDYDTLMPGRAAWDFGDFLRSAAAAGAEDDPDAAGVDVERLVAGARGVLDGLGAGPGVPTEADERAAFAAAPARMAFMLGVRFLTDHLAGDVYFRVRRPGHNLDRARAQFAIAAAFDGERGRLAALIEASADASA